MADTHTAYTDTDTLIRQLDAAEALPAAARLRARSYQLLRLPPDAMVVDVGCGTARAVAELAEHAAHAIGVDLDPAMLAAARRRFPGIDVRAADAADGSLATGRRTVTGRTRCTTSCPIRTRPWPKPGRVLVRGGRIALVGQDWDTLVIDSDQPELTRRIVHARADTIPHPRIARAYRNLLLNATCPGVRHRGPHAGAHRQRDAACCPSDTLPSPARPEASPVTKPTAGSASRPGAPTMTG